MYCPSCESKTSVLETRKYFDKAGNFYYIERKRKCTECMEKFASIEILYEVWENYCKPEEDS